MSKKWLIAIFTACWLCWPWQEMDEWLLGKHELAPLWYVLGWENIDVLACEKCDREEFNGEELLRNIDEAIEDVHDKTQMVYDLKLYAFTHEEVLGKYYADVVLLSTLILEVYGKLDTALHDFKTTPNNKTFAPIIAIVRVNMCLTGPLNMLLSSLGIEAVLPTRERI